MEPASTITPTTTRTPDGKTHQQQQRPRFRPALILHGGAGAIRRSQLPPELYERYRKSLAVYASTCKALLNHGAYALDMACHAVSMMEDDELFNCGHGSVFTVEGKIEMEASVMVTSVAPDRVDDGAIKRTGAVSGIRNTRHPIRLAKEVLLAADEKRGRGTVRDMHCHLNGREVEQWGWDERGLERKDDDWFWTKRRWDEHRRGLKKEKKVNGDAPLPLEWTDEQWPMWNDQDWPLPSQGTVGCVCFDQYGNLAVATSTGGLTNKAPGRVGDTPMAGAGFWAESWDSAGRPLNGSRGMTYTPQLHVHDHTYYPTPTSSFEPPDILRAAIHNLSGCLPSLFLSTSSSALSSTSTAAYTLLPFQKVSTPPNFDFDHDRKDRKEHNDHNTSLASPRHLPTSRRRAIAVSGTGNGDSFVRVGAARTVGAHCRFSDVSLGTAVTAMAGPGGELQRSAADRWNVTGEGQGGFIGVEFSGDSNGNGEARVVADFNCGGMWRAWFEDLGHGQEKLHVKVFRDDEEDEAGHKEDKVHQ